MKKVFFLAALLWLLLNVLTLTGYPAVWVDEILSADAGIHLAQGKGFVSSAWFNQPSWEFWASYPPLYAFALSGWLKLFGFSAFVVRSFGFVVVTAALWTIWLFLKRLDATLPSWAIVAALAVCEPVAFLARAGRPDSISLLLLGATALVFVERKWSRRGALLFMLGALSVPAALQYAAYLLVLIVLAQIWFKPFTRRDLMLWGVGAVSGAAVLAALYAAHGVLKIFIESTLVSKHSSAGRLLQNLILGHGEAPFVFHDIATASLRDYATPLLLAAGLIAWLLHAASRRLSSFGVVCAFAIPLALQLLGKYPIYYAYMGAVPAAIAIFAAYARFSGKARFASVAILIFLLLGGAGRLWWKAWTQGEQRVVHPAAISERDSVVADYPAYYELIGRVRELFAIAYAGGKIMTRFPAEQAARVDRLIVRDSLFAEVAKRVGGQWQRVGDLTVMRRGIPQRVVVIDDDSRKAVSEPIGIYVRAGNKNLSASGAR